MPTFSLLSAPPNLTVELQREENAPLPRYQKDNILIFGTELEPREFSVRSLLTSKLLRTF